MELTVTGAIFTAALKKNPNLASTLAQQYLQGVDPLAMAVFLLDKKTAMVLLESKLRSDPEGTIQALNRLPTRPASPNGKRARKQPARRRQMSAEDTEEAKLKIRKYLSLHRWATRKHLMRYAGIESNAVWRRIIGELMAADELTARGDKAKREYRRKR